MPDADDAKDQRKHEFRLRLLDVIGWIFHRAIPWCGLSVIALICYWCIAVLAGKATWAQIGVSVLGNLKVSEGIIYLFGVGGIGYGLRQRQLRQRAISELFCTIRELE